MTSEEHGTTNDTQTLDNDITIQVLLVLSQTSVDDMGEVWLHADVKEAGKSENLVDRLLADWRIHIWSNEKVLDHLQELHREEEEDTTCELSVVRLRPDPPRGEETDRGKSSRHLNRET